MKQLERAPRDKKSNKKPQIETLLKATPTCPRRPGHKGADL